MGKRFCKLCGQPSAVRQFHRETGEPVTFHPMCQRCMKQAEWIGLGIFATYILFSAALLGICVALLFIK